MAPRRKSSGPAMEDLLSAKPPAERPQTAATTAAATPEPTVPPKVLDYEPLTSGVKWRVEKFDELAAEFFETRGGDGGWTKLMARFQFCVQDFTRQWLIVRRLFGIAPIIPGPEAHPDDLRPHSRDEVFAAFNLDKESLAAELDSLRGVWRAESENAGREAEASPETGLVPPSATTAPELKLDDKVLIRHGFSESMFKVESYDPIKKMQTFRPEEESRAERDWFVGRVAEWDKMLSNSLAGPVAREALLNSLYLRRISTEMAVVSPTLSKYRELHSLKKQTEEAYGTALDKLQVMFPEMAIAGNVSFRAQISDLIAAHRAYYGFNDRRLVDKMFSVAEMEWLLNRSVQVGMRYRFGLTLAVAEARAGLYDPNFRSQFRHGFLKAADEGFRMGAVALMDAQKMPVVDLEKGVMPGEGDDFADFKTSQPVNSNQ